VDDRCGTDNSVAAGVGEQSHDGRVCSRSAGDCHYRRVGQGHSGAKTFGIKEGFYPAMLKDGKKEQNENASAPPIVGGVALLGGIVMLVVGNKKG